jgi:hypothetical protein
MAQLKSPALYTVVDVWRGMAINVYTFSNARLAERCAARLRRGRNQDEDDVQVFNNRCLSQVPSRLG